MDRKYDKWNYFVNMRDYYYEYTRELKERQQYKEIK